jgi:hypothetical protein
LSIRDRNSHSIVEVTAINVTSLKKILLDFLNAKKERRITRFTIQRSPSKKIDRK